MTPFLLAIVAGFAGSFHCVAMCGPFVSFFSLRGRGSRGGRHLAYHLGRLAAYLGLGVLVGLLGQGIFYAAGLLQLQRMILIGMGLGMIAVGVYQWLPISNRVKPNAVSAWLTRLLARTIGQHPKPSGAGLMGLCSTLLPCGFLYSFVFAAGSTGHPATAALLMFGFWLGTVPMLLGLGGLVTKMGNLAAERMARLTPAFLILFGILAVMGKWHALQAIAQPGEQFCIDPL